MKTLSVVLLLLSTSFSFGQQTDFYVPANTQRTLTPAERTLSLKSMTLGDNSIVIIPTSMDGWTVTALDVTIGQNVKIVGFEVNGAGGSNGITPPTAANCLNGGIGSSGGNGTNGGTGKNVSLTLRIRQIGSLLVKVPGGYGGYGGYGGGGGMGGSSTCSCNAGTGGNGGNGGRGGNGGNGGNVTISYKAIGSTAVSNANFTIQNGGGNAGAAGGAGTGGLGGTRSCTDPKALLRPLGASGRAGSNGLAGTKGADGITKLLNQ